jgi:heme-degrading monooxygenase HmoA
MYAVIFTARINEIDAEYMMMAKRMRVLATEKYGCVDFKSVSEGDQEVAISYWPGLKHIEDWKSDPEHIKAQALGQQRWYREYKVQIVKIKREYDRHT